MSTEPLYDQWEKQLKTQARKEGREEGRKEGQREMLLLQLGIRFGALPEEAVARVNAAGSAQLRRWAKRVFEAKTLDEVLREE